MSTLGVKCDTVVNQHGFAVTHDLPPNSSLAAIHEHRREVNAAVTPFKPKELVIGGVIAGLIAWGFTDMLLNAVETMESLPEYPPSVVPASAATIIAWIATFLAFGAVVFAIWGVSKGIPGWDDWAQRHAIRAVIPAQFLFAFVPIAVGAFVMTVLRRTSWGGWLSCLSLPTILVLVVVLLRKGKGT